MRKTDFDFQNILVIDFGQLGDVVLSLPALKSVRERFPVAKITLLLGKPGADLVKAAGVSDAQILVDRVELRDGNKFRSVAKILRLARDIRKLKFDLVIDLHSLYETNILGFVSGAQSRLFANRENRSLDWLASFPELPPKEDKSKHSTGRYFDVLRPLGVPEFDGKYRLEPSEENAAEIDRLFRDLGIADKKLIGLFIGAGHPSRCWSLDKFAALAGKLMSTETAVIVFLGPEEAQLADNVRKVFGPEIIIIDNLKLLSFMAATARLDVFVSNDTGPMHIAAVAGAPVVLVMDRRAPDSYLPITKELRVINDGTIDEITVDSVFNAINELTAGRTS